MSNDGPDYKPTPVSGMPAQPTTKSLPAVSVPSSQLDAVLDEVRAARVDVAAVATQVEVLTNTQQVFGQRLTLVEKRQDDADKRADQSSLRAKAPSLHDLDGAAELAKERAAREELAGKVDALDAKLDANTSTTELIRDAVTGVKGFAERNPKLVSAFITLLGAAFGAFTHWLTTGAHP